MMNRIIVVAGLPALLAASVAAQADTIEVGTGVNQAEVWIEFKDTAMYTFGVSFGTVPEDTVTGLDLFDIIEAETTLTTLRLTYGSDTLIDGISYDGHSDQGYVPEDDWWHYWNMEAGDTSWAFASDPVNAREVSDGDWDGWVYGKAYPPGEVPEPASLVFLMTGLAFLARRKRKHVAEHDS